MTKLSQVHIGTSGWSYEHWRARFYPSEIETNSWLNYYCRFFETVEINKSFYRLPAKKTFEAWRKQSPTKFIFAVKGSRFITHMKKLKDPEIASKKFFDNVSELKEKVGPILFQLPPRWQKNASRLNDFLASLPTNYQFAFEFRDPSWFDPEIYTILEKHGASLVISSSPSFPSEEVLTTSFVYLRMHGGAELYGSNYSDKELASWARQIKKWLSKQAKEVFVYFNNDAYAYAVQNALALKKLLNI